MKVLVDQNLPPILAAWLIQRGVEARHVRDVGLAQDGDATIAAYARDNGFIVITRDQDFGALTGRGARQPAVVWVRFGNTTNPQLFERFERAWPLIEAAVTAGETFVEIV